MRIGYAPYSRALTQPADRRRFPYYAERRGVAYELAEAGEAYDVVVVTPRADLTAWSSYRPGEAKLAFDLVDSYLDIPRGDPKALLRGFAKFLAGETRNPFVTYRTALERILRRADAVTCATPEQAAAIRPLCANVHPILDFQTRMVTAVKDDYRAGSPFKLVWEGLGENVRWFSEISGALAAVAARHPLVLHLVTAPRFKQISQRFWTRETAKIAARFFDHVEIHQWTEDSVAEVAKSCDLAVVPLPLDRPLERGKPESKLISFWRMAMPVVTSSTPAYVRTMNAAGQRFHCTTQAEWTDILGRLIEDEELRREAGTSGRAFAEREYGEERLLAAWDRVFNAL
jgi:glycosyltransferase involved in cell wall biosynthesis